MFLILLCQDLMGLFQLTYSLQHVSCDAAALAAVQQPHVDRECTPGTSITDWFGPLISVRTEHQLA